MAIHITKELFILKKISLPGVPILKMILEDVINGVLHDVSQQKDYDFAIECYKKA
jgi:hypothetical protein